MFERYTEKARRVIFFGRYEASQFGSPYIEPEYLLLGLLREDKPLANRFLRSHASVESIRKQIEGHTTIREKVSTSVDLPLSDKCKRVLAYAAEEAERLSHKHVGTEHLLLGLMREEKCFAAEILNERGLQLAVIRDELARAGHPQSELQAQRNSSPLAECSRDITHAAMGGLLDPIVGRESELDRLVEILCRRTNDNAVLIGEAGVGKQTIVEGLAQRIASGLAPEVLADKSILAFDLSSLATLGKDRSRLQQFQNALSEKGTIFVVDELHSAENGRTWRSLVDLEETLKRPLVTGRIQCISKATPSGYAESIKNHGWLERCFQRINVAPATEAEAIQVLLGIKVRYETFHGITYTEDALEHAVYYASRCVSGGQLPGKAVDLIDDAGARANLHGTPKEISELQAQIKFIIHRMESAIANHEFEKARFYSDEERKRRDNLREQQDKCRLEGKLKTTVTREDIENAVARRTGMDLATIRQTGTARPGDFRDPHS
jgi:ATP-dependent Clp protease ATP-binding subunit ClpC